MEISRFFLCDPLKILHMEKFGRDIENITLPLQSWIQAPISDIMKGGGSGVLSTS